MNAATVNVPRHFSAYPAGRYRSDGQYSGEAFRDDVLVPALRREQRVRIELDGALGYGSSFLEEAFGGLVRNAGFRSAQLRAQLDLRSSDSTLVDEIWSYIDDAQATGEQ